MKATFRTIPELAAYVGNPRSITGLNGTFPMHCRWDDDGTLSLVLEGQGFTPAPTSTGTVPAKAACTNCASDDARKVFLLDYAANYHLAKELTRNGYQVMELTRQNAKERFGLVEPVSEDRMAKLDAAAREALKAQTANLRPIPLKRPITWPAVLLGAIAASIGGAIIILLERGILP